MKKFIGIIALFAIVSLTACNKNGCPNKLEATSPDISIEVVE